MRARIQQFAPLILVMCLAVMMLAQWMDSRERRAKLDELQAKVETLKVEIEKAKAAARDRNPTQR
jgi:Tfp pilus assembly protein PilO